MATASRSLLGLAVCVCLVAPALGGGTKWWPGTSAPLGPDGAPIINPNPGKKLPDPPPSPYITRELGCVEKHLDPPKLLDTAYSSPFNWDEIVFSMPYSIPPFATPKYTECNGTICMDAYEMDLYEVKVNLGCPLGLTPMLTYNGTSPGPTFYPPQGRQSLVRINNKMYNSTYGDQHPCHHGRPASLHHHGGANTAPYDGWAEDILCPGQSKDYVFAGQEAGFLWYHDHTIDYTTEMVYYGLAGLFIVDESKRDGKGCGKPWGLEGLELMFFVVGDKTFNPDCSLYFNRPDFFVWGDVNFVNGVPWPKLTAKAAWTHVRWLAGSNERSWLLRIVDDYGNDVSSKICKVIGADHGLARVPLNVPPTGMYMAPGERYEMVCNFQGLEGRTLYVWNEYDPIRMPREVFFCYSHLIAKIEFETTTPKDAPKFRFTGPRKTVIDEQLPQTAINNALAMVKKNQCHRTFNFTADANFKWLINGETWFTVRIAADDIGQNTWEVWCLNTQPEIHHPIHMHMVAGYLIARNNSVDGLEPYEIYNPKDVFEMYPGIPLTVLIRYGPGKGEWMFHCHVTKHEDEVMMRTFIISDTAKGLNKKSAFKTNSVLTSINEVYDEMGDPYSRPPINTTDMIPLLDSLKYKLNEERPYRIYYPDPVLDDISLANLTTNPWVFNCLPKPRPNSVGQIDDAISPYGVAAVGCIWGVDGTCGSAPPGAPIGTPVIRLPRLNGTRRYLATHLPQLGA